MNRHVHSETMLAVIPARSGETLRNQNSIMTTCSCGSRNIQLKLLLFSLISSFFCFNIATFARPPNEGVYESILKSGEDELNLSYTSSATAEEKTKEAEKITEAACPAKNAPETSAKKLNEEAVKLEEDAKAHAETALKKFRYAETLMPGDGRAVFGEGLALLQLKEYCLAIEKIEFARGAIGPTLETTFALGAALVSSSEPGSKQFQDGIDLLADYINQACASRDPKAFKNLKIAKELKKKAVEKPAKLCKKNQAKDKEPNRAECPMPIPGKTELPFAASISSAVGYNDNVITLGRGQPLPPGTTQKGSLYNESSFALGRDFSLSHPSSLSSTGWLSDKLSLKYIFIADTFEEFPQNDRLLQTVLGSYQRAFTPKVAGLLKVSDQWLYIDQSISSNLFTAQEAVVLTPNARWKILVSYYLIRTDGFVLTDPANNPDGFTHRAELTQICVLMQDKHDFADVLTLTGQYAHEWDQPNGTAGRFQRDELLGKLEWKVFHARDQCSFVRGVTIAVSDRWQTDRYSDATFMSPVSSSLFARSDDTYLVVFAVSVPMWYDRYMENAGFPDANRLEANFNYSHTTRDSDVQSKAYDQNIFLASLKLNF